MVFVSSFGEFFSSFLQMFATYAMTRIMVYMSGHCKGLHRELIEALKSKNDSIVKLNESSYHAQLSSASASFWKQCFEHIIDQIGPYAKEKEKILEQADLMLSNYLGGYRERLRKSLVETCLESAHDKEDLMKKIDEMFPND